VSIGDMAFNRCGNLSTVVVLSKVVSVGSYAFYGDKALTRISATSEICAADLVLRSAAALLLLLMMGYQPGSLLRL
jgi:hypothetical protein